MQACSHLRQASAQTRQCSCMSSCFLHSVAHSAHAVRHASSVVLTVARFCPVRRLRILPVVAQRSAQSRLRRMQFRRSATISSARQASAHEVQVCAHSRHAAMPAFRRINCA